MTVESDVADFLRTALALSAEECRSGPVRKPTERQDLPGSVPSQCIFCLGTGGYASIPFIDGGQKTKEERLTVQVWVRSNPRDYDGGKSLADSAFAALDMSPPDGYFECRGMDSAATYIREDEQNHHEWSINVTLKRCT